MDWFIIFAIFLVVVGITLGVHSVIEGRKAEKELLEQIKKRTRTSTPWRG